MQVLIFALLALAVSADHWGGSSYSYAPSHGYSYSYPSTSWNTGYDLGNYGAGYGSSLYGTPYSSYKYVSGGGGLGYGGSTYYSGGHGGVAYQYQPVRQTIGQLHSAGFQTKNIGASPDGGISRISFIQDISKAPVQTQYHSSGFKPEEISYDQFTSPIVLTAPKQSSGQLHSAGFQSKNIGAAAHGGSPHITFTQDFSKALGQAQYHSSGFKPAGISYDQITSPHVLTAPKHTTGQLHRATFHTKNVGASAEGGPASISFTQDFSKAPLQAQYHSSGFTSAKTTYDRVAAPVVLTAPKSSGAWSSGGSAWKRQSSGYVTGGAPKITFTQGLPGVSGVHSTDLHAKAPYIVGSVGGSALNSKSYGSSGIGGAGQISFKQDFPHTTSVHTSGFKPATSPIGTALRRSGSQSLHSSGHGAQVSFTQDLSSVSRKDGHQSFWGKPAISSVGRVATPVSSGVAKYAPGQAHPAISKSGYGVTTGGARITFTQDLSRATGHSENLGARQRISGFSPVTTHQRQIPHTSSLSMQQPAHEGVAGLGQLSYSDDQLSGLSHASIGQTSSGISDGKSTAFVAIPVEDFAKDKSSAYKYSSSTGDAFDNKAPIFTTGTSGKGFEEISTISEYPVAFSPAMSLGGDKLSVSRYSSGAGTGLVGRTGHSYFQSSVSDSGKDLGDKSAMFVAIPGHSYVDDNTSAFKHSFVGIRDGGYGGNKESVFKFSSVDDGAAAFSKSSDEVPLVSFIDVAKSDTVHDRSKRYSTSASPFEKYSSGRPSAYSYLSGISPVSSYHSENYPSSFYSPQVDSGSYFHSDKMRD